jgi:hypothetical protein
MAETPLNRNRHPGEVIAHEVEYDFAAGDFIAFNLHHLEKSPTQRWVYRLGDVVTVMFWGCVTLMLALRGWPVSLSGWGYVVGYAVALLVSLPLVRRLLRAYFGWWIRRMLAEGANRGMFCRHRLGLTPERLWDATEMVEMAVRWPAVESVECKPDYLFLYLSAVSAVVVPRHAFRDPAEFQAFSRAAETYWQDSRTPPAKAAP